MISIEHVLDPLSGDRVTVEAEQPAGWPSPTGGPVDGRHLWVLPGLYDADQNWPVPVAGVRAGERWRALAGGAAHVNTAYPWDRIAPSTPAKVATGFEALRFPQVFPVLTVPRDRSAGFAPWLSAHAAEVRETWPPVCRLFGGDPELRRNLDAVWRAGLRVAVFCASPEEVEAVVAARAGPLHFRHITSAATLDRVAPSAGTGVTVQTAPHFLLALDPATAAGLHVRPPVPGEPDRAALLGALDRVAMIGTDHNGALPGHDGPGLDVAATLLATLVTLAPEVDGGLAALVPKVTTGPAEVFGTAARLRPSRIVVDPGAERAMTLAPGQEARRSPYAGLRLRGAVVAVVTDGVALYV